MRWPWQRETRDSSFTDTLIAQIVSQASGGTLAKPAATGALEASASIVARCFAAADVAGPDRFRRGAWAGHVEHDRPFADSARRSSLCNRNPRGPRRTDPGGVMGRYRRARSGVLDLSPDVGRA